LQGTVALRDRLSVPAAVAFAAPLRSRSTSRSGAALPAEPAVETETPSLEAAA